MANSNTPKALAVLVGQLGFVGTRIPGTLVYINGLDQMLSDIANMQGTTTGQAVTPAMQVWSGRSSYDGVSASTFGGSTGILVLLLDLWEQQSGVFFDTIWDRLEGDLQIVINNIMGNRSLVQNGQPHATDVRAISLEEYKNKQVMELGGQHYIYRQVGFSIDALPFDTP